MRILFYFGHPSQYLFLKNPIKELKAKGVICDLVIKSKDILEKLLVENKEKYINILPEGRKSGRIAILFGLLKRDLRLFKFVKKSRYDLFVGSDPSLAHIGFLRRIPVITVLEDDIDIVPELARLTFPFTSCILTPKGCSTGKYENKTVHYNGYMKLAYLHPSRFSLKASFFEQPYCLIRTSGLNAYHDNHIKGLNVALLKRVIPLLQQKGEVFISSEKPLDESLKKYELQINPSDMQHVLSNASLLISDSQSMTMEAAMLGIPSIRYSDFAGKISVLEELEQVYHLTFGIRSNYPEVFISRINELLSLHDLEEEFQRRRLKMLKDKIDVTAFIVWFIENYPESYTIINEDPEYQLQFR